MKFKSVVRDSFFFLLSDVERGAVRPLVKIDQDTVKPAVQQGRSLVVGNGLNVSAPPLEAECCVIDTALAQSDRTFVAQPRLAIA